MSQDRTGNSASREQKCSFFYIQDTTYKNPLVFRKSHLSVVCLTERCRAGGVGGEENSGALHVTLGGNSCIKMALNLEKPGTQFPVFPPNVRL